MRRRQQARCASPARLRSLRPRGHAFFISIHYPAAHIGTTEFPPPVVGAEIIKPYCRDVMLAVVSKITWSQPPSRPSDITYSRQQLSRCVARRNCGRPRKTLGSRSQRLIALVYSRDLHGNGDCGNPAESARMETNVAGFRWGWKQNYAGFPPECSSIWLLWRTCSNKNFFQTVE